MSKSDQKWVILGSLARARARARGDKIDFVLEMPCTRPCMDFPKMTQNGSFRVSRGPGTKVEKRGQISSRFEWLDDDDHRPRDLNRLVPLFGTRFLGVLPDFIG